MKREYELLGDPHGGRTAAKRLPCQKRTNSTSPYQARVRKTLEFNLTRACQLNPDRAWFLTLTLGDWKDGKFVGIDSPVELRRRWNSLNRHLQEWLGLQFAYVVPERHKSGCWHLHLFVVVESVIIPRDRFNWQAYYDMRSARGPVRYKHARKLTKNQPKLAAIWKRLRTKLPRFGFGRHEFIPVRKPEAAGSYLGKYLGKGVGENGRVTCRHLGEWMKQSDRVASGYMIPRGWSWNSQGGRLHRMVLRAVGRLVGVTSAGPWQDAFKAILGPKWCYWIWQAWLRSFQCRRPAIFVRDITKQLPFEVPAPDRLRANIYLTTAMAEAIRAQS